MTLIVERAERLRSAIRNMEESYSDTRAECLRDEDALILARDLLRLANDFVQHTEIDGFARDNFSDKMKESAYTISSYVDISGECSDKL